MGLLQRAAVARWAPAAGLALIIVAGATIGFAVSRRPPPAPPPPRPEAPTPRSAFGYSVADDPAHGEVVLFGGVDTYEQTWLWNGHRWAQAHPPSSPAGRFDSPAAYDPATRQILIFGGRLADGEVAGDTWAWDGTTWSQLDAGSAAGPPAGDGGAMAWDDALGAMVLVVSLATPGGASGETWVWTGTRWNGLAGGGFPLGVQPVAAAFNPVSDTLLAVGGEASRSPGGVLAFVPLRWVGGTSTVVQTTEHLDSFAGLAQDPSSRRLIVAAANGFPAVPTTSTAWSWTGGIGSVWTGPRGHRGRRRRRPIRRADGSSCSRPCCPRRRTLPSTCTSGRGRERSGAGWMAADTLPCNAPPYNRECLAHCCGGPRIRRAR